MQPETASTIRSWPLRTGIFLAIVTLLVWLNFGRLQRKFGLSSPDLSAVPLARHISPDELQFIRSGQAPARMVARPPADLSTAKSLTAANQRNNSPRRTSSTDVVSTEKVIEPDTSSISQVDFEQAETRISMADRGDGSPHTQIVDVQPNTLSPGEDSLTGFRQKFPEFNQVLPNSSQGPANEMAREPKLALPPQPEDIEVPQFDSTEVVGHQTFTVVDSEQAAPTLPLAETENQPLSPDTKFLTVIGGETWWTIAQEHYGNGQYFRALYRHNRQAFPDYERIPVGSRVELPSQNALDVLDHELRKSVDSSHEEYVRPLYVTRDGDTLFEIARQQLGQASRYVEIKELNRRCLPKRIGHLDLLQPGTQLILPPPFIESQSDK